jgi:hypothetical protein
VQCEELHTSAVALLRSIAPHLAGTPNHDKITAEANWNAVSNVACREC